MGNGIKAGMNGDIPGVGKASTDIAVGVISFFGGPVGWGTGLSYYVIDVTVGVESATEPLTDFVCKVTDDC